MEILAILGFITLASLGMLGKAVNLMALYGLVQE